MQTSIAIDSKCRPVIVRVASNELDPDEIFRRYADAGFLYPEKRAMLEPYLPTITENWRRGMMNDGLIQLLACENTANGKWGSVTSWRHTARSWNTQHFVSTGGPSIWGTLLLLKAVDGIQSPIHQSHQCWYQRSNGYACRAFGGILDAVGTNHAWIGDFGLFSVPFEMCHPLVSEAVFEPDPREIAAFVAEQRSPVFAKSEELDNTDLNLAALDELYSVQGLRRFRRIYAVTDLGGGIAGAVIAYRGPLGFNFSFLENRCDVILHADIHPDRAPTVVQALLAAAAPLYSDFELGCLLVTIPDTQQEILQMLGGRFVRNYAQTIWLKECFEGTLEYFKSLYEFAIKKAIMQETGL